MLQQTPDNLDELILAEKKRVAVDIFEDAWDQASAEGIETDILAEQAIVVALTHLNSASGDGSVVEMIAALAEHQERGRFIRDKQLQ